MAYPHDALAFREIFGRALHNVDSGFTQAFTVAPIKDNMPPRQSAQIVESVRKHLCELLDHGEIFYINAEITAMLYEQALAMPNKLFHFEPGDFPSRIGLVYFDSTLIRLPTVLTRTGTQPLRALLWGQLAENRGEVNAPNRSYVVPGSHDEDETIVGKIVYSVVDSIHPGEWARREFERSRDHRAKNAGPWHTRHWIPISYHERWGGGEGIEEELADQIDNTTWGQETLTEEESAKDDHDALYSVGLILRMLKVWTDFAKTEIYATSHYDSSAHDKVVLREGRPPAKVRIISLRRIVSVPQGGVVETNWQYRWKVREHYRNQRVGPGRMFVRRTLVREHVKGPPGKPLAEQDTVQAFVR